MQNQRRKQAKKSSPEGGKMGSKPPQFESTFTVGKTVRYTATAAVTMILTRASLLDSVVMASSAIAGYRIIDAVKVRRIRIWGNAPGAGAVATRTSGVQWLSFYSPSRVVSDSGSGATFGARISTKPPAMSLAGFWSLTGNNETEEIAVLQLNLGDVVDLDLTYRIQNNLFATDPPVAVVLGGAAVIGTVYILALDFVVSGAASVVIPVEYNTTT